MDFSSFDQRRYPVVAVKAGYAEWASHYDETVAEGLDLPLLNKLVTVDWSRCGMAVDLACGTGRTGAWLKARGIQTLHGVDLTREMLNLAEQKRIYDQLYLADVRATDLPSGAYDLCILALADEHLPELDRTYREAARLLRCPGTFVLIGYHPFFLMKGMPTHYHRSNRDPVTIECYVHLFSEHVQAGQNAGLGMKELEECVIDENWLATKPKWRDYLNWPVSFAMVWEKPQ